MARTKAQDKERKRAARAARYAAGLTATGAPRRRAPKRGSAAWYFAPRHGAGEQAKQAKRGRP